MVNDNLSRACRRALRALHREFRRCSSMYLPLYHEKIFPWADGCSVTVTDEEWAAFRSAHEGNDASEEWWDWDGPHPNPHWGDGGFQGRFSGCPDGLGEFVELAESAAVVLGECNLGKEVSASTYGDWLWFLHQAAFSHQIPLLRSDMGVWGFDDLPAPDEFDALITQWSSPDDGESRYPLHPLVFRLDQSVFVSSVTAIEAILDPKATITTNEPLTWGVASESNEPEGEEIPSNGDDNSTGHKVAGSPSKPIKPHCNRIVIDDVAVRITFGDEESKTFPSENIGIGYWASLLESPYKQFQPVDFLIGDRRARVEQQRGRIGSDVLAGLIATTGMSNEGVEEPDQEEEHEQRERIREWVTSLEVQREDARQARDFKVVKDIDDKLEELKGVATSSYNEFRRPRHLGRDSRERTDWNRVRINFVRALEKIRGKMPLLARHLKASWKNKAYFSYEPTPPQTWEVVRLK